MWKSGIHATCMDHVLVLKDVLLVPKLGMMLVSIPTVTTSVLTVVFTRDLVMFESNRITVAWRKQREQEYEMELIVHESLILITKMESWHLQLGHLSHDKLLELGKFYPKKKFVAYRPCEACLIEKHKRSSFQTLDAKRMLKSCVAGDICGLFSEATLNGEQYMLVLMDCESKYVKITLAVPRSVQLICKSIKDFVKHIETASRRREEKFLLDNAREFQSRILLEPLGKMNIEKISTVPYCLQPNRMVKV
jgi:hypothetical protein